MPGFSIIGSEQQSPKNDAEFHRAHRWYIRNIGLPGAGGSSGTRTRAGSAGDPKLYAHTLQLPSLSFEEEKISGGASNYYKIAKRAVWDNVTIKFYDVYGLYKIYRDWQDKIWTPDEGIKKASDYKGQPVFVLTDGQGNDSQIYTLINAYPINVNHGELSYTSNDIKLLTVTYSFDYATFELNN